VTQARDRQTSKQLCREGPGDLGGQQAEYEPAACPGNKETYVQRNSVYMLEGLGK